MLKWIIRVDLTEKGKTEAAEAGGLIKKLNLNDYYIKIKRL